MAAVSKVLTDHSRYFLFVIDIGAGVKTNENKASQAIQSPRTVPFFLLISLLDGYSFAKVHVKNCELDINHRPLKHEPIKDMFILSICVKLY